MSLLVLEHVVKRVRHGRSDIAVLDDVTMVVSCGELVAIRGARRSGRTTLLNVACGMEALDEGRVLFDGRDVANGLRLGRDVSWAAPVFDPGLGRTMAEQVAFPLHLDRSRKDALTMAKRRLADIGAGEIADLRPSECRHHELLLAGIARAAITSPRLLVLDEPVSNLSARLAEEVIELLRRFTLNGIAVLFTEDEAQLGVDRTLHLTGGRVRGATAPAGADVIPLPHRGEASA